MDHVTGTREMVCKIEGTTLNYSTSQTVKFDVINALVLREDNSETVTVHTELKIKRKRADGKVHIVTETEEKVYRVSFLKRRHLCDNTSFPFGYV